MTKITGKPGPRLFYLIVCTAIFISLIFPARAIENRGEVSCDDTAFSPGQLLLLARQAATPIKGSAYIQDLFMQDIASGFITVGNFSQARITVNLLSDPYSLISAKMEFADEYAKRGMKDASAKAIKDAKTIALSLGPSPRRDSLLTIIVKQGYMMSVEMMWATSRKIRDPSTYRSAIRSFAILMAEHGKINMALNVMRTAMFTKKWGFSTHSHNRDIGALAWINIKKKDLDASLSYAKKVSDGTRRAYLLERIAKEYLKMSDISQAKKIAGLIPVAYMRSRLRSELVSIYVKQNHNSEATNLLAKAVDDGDQVTNDEEASLTQLALGKAFAALGQREEARKRFKMASLPLTMNSPFFGFVVATLLKLGEKDDALAIFDASPVNVRVYLAKIFIDNGYGKEGKKQLSRLYGEIIARTEKSQRSSLLGDIVTAYVAAGNCKRAIKVMADIDRMDRASRAWAYFKVAMNAVDAANKTSETSR